MCLEKDHVKYMTNKGEREADTGFHTEPWERGDFPHNFIFPPKNHGLES